MGTPREAPPAKLFVAVMHRPSFDPEPALAHLAGLYGPVETRGPAFPFDGSRYYESEMGAGLVKFLASFAAPFPQERLAEVKIEANALESRWAEKGGRACNLDPGMITHYSVILATTKGYAHRVYLGKGVYAETTLIFRRHGLEALPWTYPDYLSPASQGFFMQARRVLLEQTALRGNALP